jgi:hypothetical protein
VTREDYTRHRRQAASSTLIAAFADASKWNASCTLAGIAYTYLILKWDQTAFAKGRPLITADVTGARSSIRAPRHRLLAQSVARGARLLTNARYGRGYSSAVIDDTTFQAEANHADGTVSVPGGGTQARYTCDGVLNPDDAPLDNVKALLSSCRGSLVYSGGKYKAMSDRTSAAVSFVLSRTTSSAPGAGCRPRRARASTRVKARFYDAGDALPAEHHGLAAGGLRRSRRPTSRRTRPRAADARSSCRSPPTSTRRSRSAQIECKKSRNPLLVSLTATIAAMALEVGDIVPVAHSTPGWPAVGDPAEGKLFRVEEIELLATDEVRLGLRLYDAAAYTLDTLTLQPSLTLTSLPDGISIAAPLNVAAASGTNQLFIAGDGTVVSRLLVTWDVSLNAFVTSGGHVLLQFKRQTETAWQNFTQLEGTATQAYLTPVDDGVAYDLRVAFENVARRALGLVADRPHRARQERAAFGRHRLPGERHAALVEPGDRRGSLGLPRALPGGQLAELGRRGVAARPGRGAAGRAHDAALHASRRASASARRR